MPRNDAKLIVAGALVVGLGLIATRAVQVARQHGSSTAAPSASALAPSLLVAPPPSVLPGASGVAFDPVMRKTVHFVLWSKPARACETTETLDAFRCAALPAVYERPRHAWQERHSLPDQIGSPALHFLGGGGVLRAADGVALAERANEDGVAIDAKGNAVWTRATQSVELDFALVRKPIDGKESVAIKSLRAAGARFEIEHDGGGASSFTPAIYAPWMLEPYAGGVRARRVLPVSEPVGEPVPVLESNLIPTWLGACEIDGGIAIVGSRAGRALVLYERGGRWSHVEGDRGRLIVDPDPVDRPARIDCVRDEVSLSWVTTARPKGEVESVPSTLHRIRCTPAGCDHWRSGDVAFAGSGPWHRIDQGLGGPHLDAQLAVLGDRLLATWRAPDGIRMRVGSAEGIASAPDRLLTAGAREVELQTRHGVALAFVTLDRERSAVFRIEPSGEVRALSGN